METAPVQQTNGNNERSGSAPAGDGVANPEEAARQVAASVNMTPIVETFTLDSTLPQRLIETVDWHCEQNSIRDPEARIAQMFTKSEDVGYDGFMADLLAYISTWAYADPATFAFMLGQRGMRRWRFYWMRLGNDPLYVVASAYMLQSYTGDVSIVVFRGTEPTHVMNWLTDLTISPARFFEGEVHGGVLRNYLALWPLVSMGLYTLDKRRNLLLLPLKRLPNEDTRDHDAAQPENDTETFYQDAYAQNTFDDPRKRVRPLKALYLTGHSLGGAMAHLAAAQIWKTPTWRNVRDNMVGCYSYGAPMVATPTLARTLHKELGDVVFRHVYAYDVIPQLPPASTGKFEHFGQEYRCYKNGTGWMLSEKPCLQTSSFSMLPMAALGIVFEQFPPLRALAAKLPISIDHHSPRYYMRSSELSLNGVV